MSRIRLVKLLYIADREAIQETATPITGDDIAAMPHGPVPTRIFASIRGEGFDSVRWGQFLHSSGYEVVLAADPGVEHLAPYEVRKLREVARRFEAWDDWEIVDYTHEFPEWKRHAPQAYADGRDSHPIPPRDILEAVGLGDEAAEIISEAKGLREVDRLLAQGANP